MLYGLTGDFDGDGWPDIYVPVIPLPACFFIHRNGTLEIGSRCWSRFNEDGREQAVMGAHAVDMMGRLAGHIKTTSLMIRYPLPQHGDGTFTD